MKTVQEIALYLQERIGELGAEIKESEEEGLEMSALSSECTKQELEEILELILTAIN